MSVAVAEVGEAAIGEPLADVIAFESREDRVARCAEEIRRLPLTPDVFERGLEIIGGKPFQRSLAASLHLAEGHQVLKWGARNSSSGMLVSLISGDLQLPDAGKSYHDVFVTEKSRPLSEDVICLFGKLAHLREQQDALRTVY